MRTVPIRCKDTGQQPDRRGLSGPVGTEEPEDLTLPDRKADIVHCGYGTESFDEVPGFDCVHDSSRVSAGDFLIDHFNPVLKDFFMVFQFPEKFNGTGNS